MMQRPQFNLNSVFLKPAVMALFVLAQAASSVDAGSLTGAEKVQLLAAFTFNVAKFVTWTKREALRQPKSILHIGVYQNPELFKHLVAITKGKTLDGHVVEVVELNSVAASSAPEIVMLITNVEPSVGTVLKTLKGCNCLVVTGDDQDSQEGSVVNFFTVDEHLRFSIDLERAKAEGLDLSSQLLKLGKLR